MLGVNTTTRPGEPGSLEPGSNVEDKIRCQMEFTELNTCTKSCPDSKLANQITCIQIAVPDKLSALAVPKFHPHSDEKKNHLSQGLMSLAALDFPFDLTSKGLRQKFNVSEKRKLIAFMFRPPPPLKGN